MQIEALSSTEEIVSLLAKCALPVADLHNTPSHNFFGIRRGGHLVAVIGIERYAPCGLLRSLAVCPQFRGQGLASELVEFIESYSVIHDIESLFLLTTTAAAFFIDRGYSPAQRNAAPDPIRATAQFSGLCPSSATFLHKPLSHA